MEPQRQDHILKTDMLYASWAQVPLVFLRCRELSDRAFRVMVAILSYVHMTGRVFPSLNRLALDSGTSKRSVQRSLQELRDLGLLKWDKEGYGNTNEYRLSPSIDLPETVTKYHNESEFYRTAKRLVREGADPTKEFFEGLTHQCGQLGHIGEEGPQCGQVGQVNVANVGHINVARAGHLIRRADEEEGTQEEEAAPGGGTIEEALSKITEETPTGKMRVKGTADQAVKKRKTSKKGAAPSNPKAKEETSGKSRVIHKGSSPRTKGPAAGGKSVAENLKVNWIDKYRAKYGGKTLVSAADVSHLKQLGQFLGEEDCRALFDLVMDRWEEFQDSFGVRDPYPTIRQIYTHRNALATVLSNGGKFPESVQARWRRENARKGVERPLEDPNQDYKRDGGTWGKKAMERKPGVVYVQDEPDDGWSYAEEVKRQKAAQEELKKAEKELEDTK